MFSAKEWIEEISGLTKGYTECPICGARLCEGVLNLTECSRYGCGLVLDRPSYVQRYLEEGTKVWTEFASENDRVRIKMFPSRRLTLDIGGKSVLNLLDQNHETFFDLCRNYKNLSLFL
jgi:hypothetical protein